MALGTTLANVKVGRGQRYGDSLLQKSLQQLAKAQTLLTIDILELLEETTEANRRTTLLAYQRSMEGLLEEMAISYEGLTSVSTERAAAATECLRKKQE